MESELSLLRMDTELAKTHDASLAAKTPSDLQWTPLQLALAAIGVAMRHAGFNYGDDSAFKREHHALEFRPVSENCVVVTTGRTDHLKNHVAGPVIMVIGTYRKLQNKVVHAAYAPDATAEQIFRSVMTAADSLLAQLGDPMPALVDMPFPQLQLEQAAQTT